MNFFDDDCTIRDKATLSAHASKVIQSMDDNLTKVDILFVLAAATAAVLFVLAKNDKQVRTAPAMFAAMLKELLTELRQ